MKSFPYSLSVFSLMKSASTVAITFPSSKSVFLKAYNWLKMVFSSSRDILKNQFFIPMLLQRSSIWYELSSTIIWFLSYLLRFILNRFCGTSLDLIHESLIKDGNQLRVFFIGLFVFFLNCIHGFSSSKIDHQLGWISWLEDIFPTKTSMILTCILSQINRHINKVKCKFLFVFHIYLQFWYFKEGINNFLKFLCVL